MARPPTDASIREIQYRLDNWATVYAGTLGLAHVTAVLSIKTEVPEPLYADAELIERHMLRLKLLRRKSYNAIHQKHACKSDLTDGAKAQHCSMSEYRDRLSKGYYYLLGSLEGANDRRAV